MADAPKILVFAGSTRKASFNRKLATVAGQLVEAAGGTTTCVELADYPLPMMNEDLEAAEGVPENARKLKALMKSHSGFLIACPEYNSSITPMLKNVIDWCSRKEEGEKPLECYVGKVVALVSASPGALGGLRGLYHVRDIFLNINAIVLPNMLAISGAPQAFNDQGELIAENHKKTLTTLTARLVEVARRISV